MHSNKKPRFEGKAGLKGKHIRLIQINLKGIKIEYDKILFSYCFIY